MANKDSDVARSFLCPTKLRRQFRGSMDKQIAPIENGYFEFSVSGNILKDPEELSLFNSIWKLKQDWDRNHQQTLVNSPLSLRLNLDDENLRRLHTGERLAGQK